MSESETHSLWTHVVRAAKNGADMAVDLGAITGIAYLGTTSISEANFQIAVGAIASIAIGKRYMQAKRET